MRRKRTTWTKPQIQGRQWEKIEVKQTKDQEANEETTRRAKAERGESKREQTKVRRAGCCALEAVCHVEGSFIEGMQ